VFDQYLAAEGNDNCDKHGVWGDEDFAGWCVLNTNSIQAEREENGFKGTWFTKNKASYGVRLFLNICASYLKAKRRNKGDIRQAMELDYEEPFGKLQETKGTEEFPWFDFQCPSIIQQSTSHDCGLAVVANSMAFFKHLKGKQFMKSNMKRQESNEICFLLDETIYSLKPFWDRVMKDAGQMRYGKLSDSDACCKRCKKSSSRLSM
jgi:hypothetical protein